MVCNKELFFQYNVTPNFDNTYKDFTYNIIKCNITYTFFINYFKYNKIKVQLFISTLSYKYS